MTPPFDPRLDELFVRYWDDALTDAEAEHLERLLVADPVVRERFTHFAQQAVIAAHTTAVGPARRWLVHLIAPFACSEATVGRPAKPTKR